MKLSVNRTCMACAILTLLLLLGWSSPLSADTVFSNLSSFCECGAVFQGAGEPSGAGSLAVEFTPTGNFTFTEAELGLDAAGVGDSINVYLETISSTGTGTVIGQIGSEIAVPEGEEYITADSFTTPITLSDGVSYWLVATAATDDTSVDWEGNGTQAVPIADSSTDGPDGPWDFLGDTFFQFAIDGTPATTTPTAEPASFLLLGTGLVGLALAIRRRTREQRAARTISGSSPQCLSA
jgi:hypothetical protein